MTYSLIKPKVKPLISKLSKYWLYFIAFVVILMIVFNFFILIKTHFMKMHITSMQKLQLEYEQKILNLDNNAKRILEEKGMIEEIFASNEMLKNEIQNNFNQVPDEITLSKIELDKNSLIIYGTTPSKDLFNFVLALPLKARYDTSDTVFYLNKQGVYRFVSTNKINQDKYNEQ